MRKNYLNIFIIAILAVTSVQGCAYHAYKEVLKEKQINNQQIFDTSPETLYNNGFIPAILSKGFIIEEVSDDKDQILAVRSIKKGKRTWILALQAHFFKLDDNKTRLYLNAIETTERTYVADRTRFFLFVVPLPGGGGKEASQIKEGTNTIKDEKFYDQMFSLVSDFLNEQ